MSETYFISDLHLGHKNILKFSNSRAGSTVDEHDEQLIASISSTVCKRDNLYILGDVCFDIKKMDMLRRINCRKVLLLGNHDEFNIGVYLKYFDKVAGLLSYKGFWLSHAPVHPAELRGKINIHGHVHSADIPDERYFNVCVESLDGVPVSLSSIRGHYE